MKSKNKKIETVADLISALLDFPPETRIGGADYFGDPIPAEYVLLRDQTRPDDDNISRKIGEFAEIYIPTSHD